MLEPAGEQPEVRPAEAERRAERLALANHHVGAVLPRRTHQPRRHGVERHEQQRPGAIGHLARACEVLEAAEVVGVLHEDGGGHAVVGIAREPVGDVEGDEVVAGADGERVQHLAPRRVHASRHPDRLAPRRRDREVDGLDARAGPVVERRVRHLGARQAAQQRLVLEQHL